jgi:hypothetical protein
MSSTPLLSSSRRASDPVARTLAGAGLVVALLALVFAMTGLSQARDGTPRAAAAAKKKLPGASTTPKKYGLLRLNAKKRFPAVVIPKVAAAKEADALDGANRADLEMNCPATSVDLGSWCLDASTYPVPNEDIGKNDFAYATKACVEAGGFLPTAAQLLGAASRVRLASTIDDNRVGASIDEDATDGLKDQREMSATLFTLTTGSSAAGSQGVTAGSRGDPKQSEPDPVPFPADPRPDTVNYMTVYDNHDEGGLAGGKAIGATERFRCAYAQSQGPVREAEG